MGILNITPDSFSDGGKFLDQGSAVKQALQMVEDGADIIDIGGESTRPGSERVSASQQVDRIIPVMRELVRVLPDGFPLSIDTTRAAVAEEAIMVGASIINDISAGEDDLGMFPLAARTNTEIILMHKRGTPATMQDNPVYGDVVTEVCSYLLDRAAAAVDAGVDKHNITVDPGMGFGKTLEHNLQLLTSLDSLVATGYPVLLGASRKNFLKKLSLSDDSRELAGATCATTVLGVSAGARILRVHDVKQNRQALDVTWAFRVSLEA